jgi:glycosyltransferase involved in cell wall biosynthesis
MPFFSIITPTYNRAKFINKALESVLKQTFLDFEYIIIDDGSTDNTRGIIETFSDNRIRYIYQENQERSAARNHGIDLANGQYICFLDSDDYYLENHLEILWQNITKIAKPGLYYTQSYKQNIQSNIITPIIQNTNVSKINFLLNNFLFINSICISTSIMKQKEFQFPIEYNSWEDLFVWFQIVAVFPIHFINVGTTVIRVHHTNSSMIFTLKELEYIINRFKCIDNTFMKLTPIFSKSQKNKYITLDAYGIFIILIHHNQIKKSVDVFKYILKKHFDMSCLYLYTKTSFLITLKIYFNRIYLLIKPNI